MEKRETPNVKYFCSLPFNGAQINEEGTVKPCCNWDPADQNDWPNMKDGLTNAVQHPRFQEVRDNMLNDIYTPGCRRCFENERAKKDSTRLANLSRDKDWIKQNFDNNLFNKDFYELHYLDTTFSILCNLSCRMCSGMVSSTFGKIIEKDNITDSYDISEVDIDVSKLDRIKFVGGEPLMEPKHNLFLEKIVRDGVNLKNLDLVYHTNATKLPTKAVQEIWKKCKSVLINLSIDGYKDTNWIQRPGSYTWDDIERVCKQYKEWSQQSENIRIRVSSVITKINIFHLHELEKWIDDFWGQEFYEKDHSFFGAYCIEWPKQLSICDWYLNEEKKKQVNEYIFKIKNNKIRNHIKFWIKNNVGRSYGKFDYEQEMLNDYWKYDIDKYL